MRLSKKIVFIMVLMLIVINPIQDRAQSDMALGMEQVIYGGFYDLLPTSATEYNSIAGGFFWRAIENEISTIASTDGVLKNLRVKLSGTPDAGNSYSFTLMVNNAPTSLSTLISDSAINGSDIVDEIVITGGDLLSIRVIPTSTPTARYSTWTLVFEGDNEAESIIMGGRYPAISNTVTAYSQIMGAPFSSIFTSETNVREVVPTNGTFKNLHIWMSEDAGSIGNDAFRFTLMKGGAAQVLTTTLTADSTTGSDLVNSFDAVAGNIVTMRVEPLNTPSATPYVKWSVTFVADVDGESIVMGGTTNDLSNSATEYNYPSSYDGSSWNSDPIIRQQLGQHSVIKNFYMLLGTAPSSGDSFTFSLGVGDSNDVVFTISNFETSGNSGTLNDTLGLDEYLNIKVVPFSLPTGGDTYWGFVSFIDPGEIIITTAPTKLFGAGFNGSIAFVELYWSHINVTEVDSFEVQHSTNGLNFTFLDTTPNENYNHTNLANGSYHWYKIRATLFLDGEWFNSSYSEINLEKVYFTTGGGEPGPPDNVTILSGSFVTYNVSSIDVVVGTYVHGNLTSTVFVDNKTYQVDEVVETPAWDIRFNFTGIPENSTSLSVRSFDDFEGNPAHEPHIEAYNFDLREFVDIVFYHEGVLTWHNVSLSLGGFIQNETGNVWIRFIHHTRGAPGHVINVDYLRLRAFVPTGGVDPNLDAWSINWLLSIIWIALVAIGVFDKNKIMMMFAGFFGAILSILMLTVNMMVAVALLCINLYLLYEGTK